MKHLRILLIVVFLGITCSFFYKTFTGKLPVPTDSLVGLYHPWRDLYADTNPRGMPFKNFLITDPVRQLIPWRNTVINQWKQGEIPGWNPYAFSGTTLRGNIQAAPFYPFNILFFMFSFDVAWALLIIFQPVLAGIFLYCFLSSRKLHPLASLLGAVSWSFSGFFVAWLTWGTIGHTVLWLPLMLLAVDRIVEQGPSRRTWSIVLALVWTFSFFAGHVQIFLYGCATSIGYFLWRLAHVPGRTSKLAALATIVLSVVVFVALSAIQWVPMLPGIAESSRIVSADWQKEGWFLPWEHLVQFIAPDFFGNPATLNYWGTWNYGEFVGYIGIVPLFFALYAVFHVLRRRRILLLIPGAIFLFLLPTPVASLPYVLSVPVISALQPTRLISVVVFIFVLFSSYGANAWLAKKKNGSVWTMLSISGVFVLLWGVVVVATIIARDPQLIANLDVARRNLILPTGIWGISFVLLFAASMVRKGRISKGILVLLLCITTVDLFRFGWKFTPFVDRSFFFPETTVLKFLASQPKPFRVMTMDDRILPPNTSAYFGIESIEGYDPIFSSQYETFIAAAAHGSADVTPPYGFDRILTLRKTDPAILMLLNVRYVLSFTDLPPDQFTLVLTEGETKVYEFVHYLPRVFFVDYVIEESRNPDMLARVFAAGFAPGKSAYHVGPIPDTDEPTKTDTVTIDTYSDNGIMMETNTHGSRLLFVSMPYNAMWNVFIDGEKSAMYRIDYLFSGIVVPGGTHTIELKVL